MGSLSDVPGRSEPWGACFYIALHIGATQVTVFGEATFSPVLMRHLRDLCLVRICTTDMSLSSRCLLPTILVYPSLAQHDAVPENGDFRCLT